MTISGAVGMTRVVTTVCMVVLPMLACSLPARRMAMSSVVRTAMFGVTCDGWSVRFSPRRRGLGRVLAAAMTLQVQRLACNGREQICYGQTADQPSR